MNILLFIYSFLGSVQSIVSERNTSCKVAIIGLSGYVLFR